MVLQDPENAPKDLQQIHTKNITTKKQTSHAAKANIADEVLHILSMVNNHDFVKEVVYTQDNNVRRSTVGNGIYELFGNFKKHKIQHSKWHSISQIEKEVLYRKLATDKKFSDNMLRAANGFAIPKVKRLAKKPGQRHRPKSAAVRTNPKF
ncbi:unnamed protein product [Mytilus coruscus]|uniref:Uncharacterized protein n=1 Tax=Mytilus coruscus TaxID=42192 RepID=A0A6J7ZUX3_MYTCO|nr:unnamed protein product [Mytilus coruscus]